ncbi:MAG: signal peptidase II [Candidatus Omnitrophica bacterium]|nr:signal peptidase II [Candidatus Omnitrophota bacterium]
MPAGKRKNLNFYLFLFILFIFIFSVDRYTKLYIINHFFPLQSIPIIKNIFHLTFICNTGGFFGVFKNNNFIFIIVSFLAIILIIRDLRDASTDNNFKVALTLIIAGAMGNLIDRLLWGYVIDFLDFRIWPVFNIADTSISCGVILIIYRMFIKNRS